MQQYVTLVVAALVLLLAPAEGMPPELMEKMDSAIATCKTRFNPSQDDIDSIQSTGKLKNENSEVATCFTQCLMEELGFVKDGIFSVEDKIAITKEIFKDHKVPEGAPPMDLDKVRQGVAECVSAATGDTTCAKNYNIWACMVDKREASGMNKKI